MSRMRWLVSGNEQRWLPIRLGCLVTIMLVAAFLASVAVFLLLAWRLPTAFSFEKKPFEVLKVVVGVVGSIGAVFALTVAYRKQQINECADEREDTRLFNERFGAASAQLASDKPAERLAGVHALAGLADDWDSGRQTCIDVLCAYMTMPHSHPADLNQESQEAHRAAIAENRVRHTIMDIISSKLRQKSSASSWHGHAFRFGSATLDYADFSDTRLTEDTHLDFDGTIINKEVTFARASIDKATISFACAIVGRANFTGVQLTKKANLNFNSTQFGNKILFSGMVSNGASISFRRSSISGHACFDNTSFSAGSISFENMSLKECKVDFRGAKLRNTSIKLCNVESLCSDEAPVDSSISFKDVAHMDQQPVVENEANSEVKYVRILLPEGFEQPADASG